MIRCRGSGPDGSVRSALARPRLLPLHPRLRVGERASPRLPSSRSRLRRSSLRTQQKPNMVRRPCAAERRLTSRRNRPSMIRLLPSRPTRLPRLLPRTPRPWQPPLRRRQRPSPLHLRRYRMHRPRVMHPLLPRRHLPLTPCRRHVRHRSPAPRRRRSNRCLPMPAPRRVRSRAPAAGPRARRCVPRLQDCPIVRVRQAPAFRPAVAQVRVAATSVGRARSRPRRRPSVVRVCVRPAAARHGRPVPALRARVLRHEPAGILVAAVARRASAVRSIRLRSMQTSRRR